MKRFIFGGLILGAIAGTAYLAALGSCRVLGVNRRKTTMTQGLNLNSAQKEKITALKKEYLTRKQAGCETLCAKRAQLIQALKQEEPDPSVLNGIIEEIGREQIALEKATLDHLLAVSRSLDTARRERLIASMSEELRLACKATACGRHQDCLLRQDR